MRIAQVAPLYESVPPRCYGGTERVVSYLTEELVKQGHEVSLFASGDSVTTARLVAPCRRSLRLDTQCIDQLAHHILMLELVLKETGRFDLIHWHVDYLHFPLSQRQSTPHVTTLHGRLDIPDLVPLYQEFKAVPVISISNAQREPLPWLNCRIRCITGCRRIFTPFVQSLGNTSPVWGASRPRSAWTEALRSPSASV